MSTNTQRSDDYLEIIDDEGGPVSQRDRGWRVLIVDDDEDVHASTRFALRDATILGRSVELLHFRSAEEVRERIDELTDIAVAFIDVVMETPDAGLKLVHELREAGLDEMRIVLRTGQPGYAPELAVVSKYQIDDYRTKAELTRTRLITVLTSSIRAYDQICTINRSRAGLEMIIESSTELFKRTNLELFSLGVLTQIAALLHVHPKGVVCINSSSEDVGKSRIVSATGRFAHFVGKSATDISDPVVLAILKQAYQSAKPVTADGYFALRVSDQSRNELIALIEMEGALADTELTLLKLFSGNITIALENLSLVDRLDELAFVDTSLHAPNLNAFDTALQERIGAQKPGFRVALLEIEGFHSILADYGSQTALNYLRQVYQALTQPPAPPTVARIGDGTFALLGDDTNVTSDAITSAVSAPYNVDGVEIVRRASSVILDFDGTRTSTADVMRDAISALAHVKHTGRTGCVSFDQQMRSEVGRRSRLQSAFKKAVEHGDGFEVYAQPKVNLATDECIGVEALLRWRHNEEFISPSEFIPIAESTGLIQPLTEFVIAEVGNWFRGRETRKGFSVAVNLSMADLNRPGFAARLLGHVEAAGLRPEAIEFEVTEGIAKQDTPNAVEQVQMLREAGHMIALDDFGTGYSSLGQFDSLPIDVLKIDRSFVSRLNVRTAKRSLAAIVLAMADALNVECVAEGIETEEQKQALIFLGCAMGQGYLFGRPQPIAEFDCAPGRG